MGFGLSVCVSDLGCCQSAIFFLFLLVFLLSFFVLLHWFLMGIGYSGGVVAVQ